MSFERIAVERLRLHCLGPRGPRRWHKHILTPSGSSGVETSTAEREAMPARAVSRQKLTITVKI